MALILSRLILIYRKKFLNRKFLTQIEMRMLKRWLPKAHKSWWILLSSFDEYNFSKHSSSNSSAQLSSCVCCNKDLQLPANSISSVVIKPWSESFCQSTVIDWNPNIQLGIGSLHVNKIRCCCWILTLILFLVISNTVLFIRIIIL